MTSGFSFKNDANPFFASLEHNYCYSSLASPELFFLNFPFQSCRTQAPKEDLNNMLNNEILRTTIALESGSAEENVEIIIAPPHGQPADIEMRNRHFKLYRAALIDDWNTAEKIFKDHKNDITAKLSKEGDTALHIAAAARSTYFMGELLEWINIEDLAIKNNGGNTAFFLAIASGEVEIVKVMMKKNADLAKNRGNNDMLPLHEAAIFGNEEMVDYLYKATPGELLYNDRIELLFSLINSGLYDFALDLVNKHPELATARDKNEETVFHSLVQLNFKEKGGFYKSVSSRTNESSGSSAFELAKTVVVGADLQTHKGGFDESTTSRANRSSGGYSFTELIISAVEKAVSQNLKATFGKKKPSSLDELPVTVEEIPSSALKLFKCLWKEVMLLDDLKISEIIRKPWPLIFVAAKQGNIAFLKIIFTAYPDMIFEVDGNGYSIFHFAVLHRHSSIFKLIYEIGSFKDLLVQNTDEEGNNILHLAARLPPPNRPNIESRAALQLLEELVWFEEVKKLLHPLDAEAINKDGKTARAIFTEQHEKLKEKAETWIKDTVNSCMMAATIIATVVFAAAFTVPGGINEETGTPHFVHKALFIIFAISDAMALLFSSSTILIFLSIISSRYALEDFLSWLPQKLDEGLLSLAYSISTMMIVFCATIFIVFQDGKLWVPIVITLMAYMIIGGLDGLLDWAQKRTNRLSVLNGRQSF